MGRLKHVLLVLFLILTLPTMRVLVVGVMLKLMMAGSTTRVVFSPLKRHISTFGTITTVSSLLLYFLSIKNLSIDKVGHNGLIVLSQKEPLNDDPTLTSMAILETLL